MTETTQQVAAKREKLGGVRFFAWNAALLAAAIVMPFLLGPFYVDSLSAILVYAIAGLGLQLLSGVAGQVSIGHAAFIGIGAYLHAYLLTLGVPFLVSLPIAALVAGFFGFAVGLPMLRLAGVYLAICTLAFAIIVEQVFSRWEAFTNGLRGRIVPKPELFGLNVGDSTVFYFLCLATLVLAWVIAHNLVHSPTGRAWLALRDSEIAARAVGVNLAVCKTIAFAISAAFAGLAGALFSHRLNYLSPEIFTVQMSIELLLMIVIGGLGSLYGAVIGAFLVGLLPVGIALVRDHLPPALAQQPGIEPGIFGLILVFVILFMPDGIVGQLSKARRHWFGASGR